MFPLKHEFSKLYLSYNILNKNYNDIFLSLHCKIFDVKSSPYLFKTWNKNVFLVLSRYRCTFRLRMYVLQSELYRVFDFYYLFLYFLSELRATCKYLPKKKSMKHKFIVE